MLPEFNNFIFNLPTTYKAFSSSIQEDMKIKSLYRRVIVQAFIDYGCCSKNRRTKGMKIRAHDWIMHNNDGFYEVCSMAEVSPHLVRLNFIHYKAGKLSIGRAIERLGAAE